MQTLRFSHNYNKFPFKLRDMDRVILLEVLTADSKDLHESFVKYDTEIKTHQTTCNHTELTKYYKLHSGKVIILILQAIHEIWDGKLFGYQSSGLFTTVRRWTSEKEVYYRELRGQQVKIEIKENMTCRSFDCES